MPTKTSLRKRLMAEGKRLPHGYAIVKRKPTKLH